MGFVSFWNYRHKDLHVRVPGRTPRVLLAPMPGAQLACWALTAGLLGITGQVFMRMYSFKGLYL